MMARCVWVRGGLLDGGKVCVGERVRGGLVDAGKVCVGGGRRSGGFLALF